MLSTVPTKQKNKPRNWTVTILVGVIIILAGALSGLAGLYISGNHINQPNTIIVNQTPNNTSNYNNQSVQNPSPTKNQANSTNPNSNTQKTYNQGDNEQGTGSGAILNQTSNRNAFPS